MARSYWPTRKEVRAFSSGVSPSLCRLRCRSSNSVLSSRDSRLRASCHRASSASEPSSERDSVRSGGSSLSVHHLDFVWVARIAKLYELQALYNRRQDDLVTYLATTGSEAELAGLSKRLETVVELHDALLGGYEEVHPDLGAAEANAAE